MSPSPAVPGHSRETTLRRDEEGRWFHDGVRVTNEKVALAFDRWIDVLEDGRFILKNDVNWAFVEIEGAPVIVRSAHPTADGVTLWLSDGRSEFLDLATVRQGPDGRLYCTVRGGRLTARFSRRAVLSLEPILAEDERGICLRVGGTSVAVSTVEDPLSPSRANRGRARPGGST